MSNTTNRRYFIIHFTGVRKDGYQQRGKIHMFVENDGYVNEGYIQSSVSKNFKLTDVYVDRVEELDEADFYDFIDDDYPYETSWNIKVQNDADDEDLDQLI